MSHTSLHYEDVDPYAPGMYTLRDALDCERLGVTVLDIESGWTGKEHDHAHNDQEEVYVLLSGSGSITVDGEEESLDTGDAVRVDPEATRQLHFDADSQMVIAGAP